MLAALKRKRGGTLRPVLFRRFLHPAKFIGKRKCPGGYILGLARGERSWHLFGSDKKGNFVRSRGGCCSDKTPECVAAGRRGMFADKFKDYFPFACEVRDARTLERHIDVGINRRHIEVALTRDIQ